MKCLARCALALSLILLGGVLALGTLAWFATGWLNDGDAPVKADRMLVLAGEPARFVYAAELYRQGYAPEIYISKPARLPSYTIFDELRIPFPRFEELYRAILVRKGVDDQHIHYLGEALLSTIEEARAMRELQAVSSRNSLLIVTSPYHVWRVKRVFRDALPGVAIAVVATPYERFPARWWTDQDTARNVLLEIAKIAFYLMGGRFMSSAASS